MNRVESHYLKPICEKSIKILENKTCLICQKGFKIGDLVVLIREEGRITKYQHRSCHEDWIVIDY
jgi:hypothetical protein